MTAVRRVVVDVRAPPVATSAVVVVVVAVIETVVRFLTFGSALNSSYYSNYWTPSLMNSSMRYGL